jgi:uncharacterized membrane protein
MSVVRHVRNTLLQGLLYLLPIWVSVVILWFVLSRISALSRPFLVAAFHLLDVELPSWALTGMALVFSLFLIYCIGLIGMNFLGRKVLGMVDRALLSAPVLKGIYGGTKQVIDALTLRKKSSFSDIVAVEYPRQGVWTIAFVTKRWEGMSYLFVPTTPNPTSGWLLLVPDEQLRPLDLTMDDAIKLIVSGGIVGDPLPAHLFRRP